MRSRTELVTTTFIDSEEDESESDDSEEDWQPDSTNRSNGGTTKKRKPKSRRLKRKSLNLTNKSPPSSSSSFSPFKRQKFETATFKEEPDSDDGSGGSNANYCQQPQQYFPITTNQITARLNILKDGKPLSQKVVAEQSMPDERGIFQLYLYKKDLDKDYRTNSNLCLWRRDGSSLLQKYIRIKTNNTEDFIFTSSSVYSSWDERRRKDFAILAVKCLEENNRRVTILNISDLHSLAEDVIRKKELKTENYDDDDDDDSSNEINENSQGDIYDEEDEDEYDYIESDNSNDDDSSTDAKDDNGDEEENDNDYEEQKQEEDNDDDGDDENDDDNDSGNDYSHSAKIVKDDNEENNDEGNKNDEANQSNTSTDINPKTP